jgi:hypothetical protein
MSASGVAIASLVIALLTTTLTVFLGVHVVYPSAFAAPTKPSEEPDVDPDVTPDVPTDAPGNVDWVVLSSVGGCNKDIIGPGADATTYRVLVLQQFVTPDTFMVLRSPEPNVERAKFVLQIGGGSGTDRGRLTLFLINGGVKSGITNADVLDKMPYTQEQVVKEIHKEANREDDAEILPSELFACTTPGKTYTVGILLTFYKGQGTNDDVRLFMPDKLEVKTTSSKMQSSIFIVNGCPGSK